MKKLLLISMLIGAMPLAMMAQDDDLYFVPKKNKVEKVTDNYGMPRETYYSGSDRSIDDYNRKKSTYETIDKDSLIDVIDFSSEQGVYPDSVKEDFELTKRMSRFDDYDLSDNAAFWAGYDAGRSDWAWHSPWYYSRFGWYGGWYDPWYYGNWRYGWYDPWYYGYGGWYNPWYYGYYNSWRYGWYDPWYYGPSWYGYGIVNRPHVATIGRGTIRRDGNVYNGGHSAFNSNSTRMTTLRNRNVSGHSRYGGNRSSGTYSGSSSRNSDYNRSSSFGGSRSSSSSYGGSSSGSRGGGFSGGSSGGGSRGGGGGGSRMGGRR